MRGRRRITVRSRVPPAEILLQQEIVPPLRIHPPQPIHIQPVHFPLQNQAVYRTGAGPNSAFLHAARCRVPGAAKGCLCPRGGVPSCFQSTNPGTAAGQSHFAEACHDHQGGSNVDLGRMLEIDSPRGEKLRSACGLPPLFRAESGP